MMRHALRLLTLTPLLLATTEQVDAFELLCPYKLDVEESIDILPNGWTQKKVSNANGLLSMDIANEDGIGIGADDETELKAKHYISTWQMDYLKSLKGKIFARCVYTNSNMALLRAIPENVRTCTVETKLLNGLPRPKMTCTE